MPTEPRQVPVSPQLDAARRRLHIHGIKEMPAGYDAEVAELFRDLRAATTLTEMDLAARLGNPGRGGAGARARSALCAAALARDLPRRECLWRVAQSRCPPAAQAHLCAARGGDRGAPAESDPRRSRHDAARVRGFRIRARQPRARLPHPSRYSLAARPHAPRRRTAGRPLPHRPLRKPLGRTPLHRLFRKAGRTAQLRSPAASPWHQPPPAPRPAAPQPPQAPPRAAAAAAPGPLRPKRRSRSPSCKQKPPRQAAAQPATAAAAKGPRASRRAASARGRDEATSAGTLEMGRRPPHCLSDGVRTVDGARQSARPARAAIPGPPSATALDPDDPRSRKADRLPSPF